MFAKSPFMEMLDNMTTSFEAAIFGEAVEVTECPSCGFEREGRMAVCPVCCYEIEPGFTADMNDDATHKEVALAEGVA